MDGAIDRILFGGKPKSVIPHRVEDVAPFQPCIAGEDISGDIAEWVADVQPRAAGVREHIQDVEFRFGRIVGYFVGPVRCPALLPFLFNISEVVLHKPCWKKVKSLSGPEIMRTNNRYEEDKSTSKPLFLFIPLKLSIKKHGAIRERVCQTFHSILFHGGPGRFTGLVPAGSVGLDRDQRQ